MSSKNLRKALEDLGIRDVGARVYLAVLELGEAIASDVAKKAKMKRPSVYVILKELKSQGLVSSYTRSKVTRFVALDPQRLMERVSERLERAQSLLPELKALYKGDEESQPRIQFFEGKEGLISIMEDTLVTPNKTIKAWMNADLAWETLRDYYPTYIRKKNERKIHVRGFFVDNEMGRTFKKRGSMEDRNALLVPEEKYPMTNEINIYDDKVFIISHKDMMGVIIQNEEIANTQRSIFDFCWDLANKSS